MSHDNPQLRVKKKRRPRGSGGLHRKRGTNSWIAAWNEQDGRRRQRQFRNRHDAERWLRTVSTNARTPVLDHLRELLWAELQARLRFGTAEIVSTKSRRIA